MNFFNIYNYSVLIYLIPCYSIYLFFTIKIFLDPIKLFRTSFFKLIKILAIIDLIMIPISVFAFRLGHIEFLYPLFLSLPKLVCATLIYVLNSLQHAQFFVHFYISFNRLTAVLIPQKYKTLWRGKPFLGMATSIFVIPGLYMSWMAVYGAYVNWDKVQQMYTIQNVSTGSPFVRKSVLAGLVAAISAILTFIMDVSTFILLRRHRETLKISETTYKKDLQLLGISVILLIAHCIYLAAEVTTFTFTATGQYETATFLWPIHLTVVDFYSLISPFCICIINKDARSAFFKSEVSSTPTVHISGHDSNNNNRIKGNKSSN